MVPEVTTQIKGQRAPVIAIGASVGGLEACSALVKALPGDIPFAFVLILNLDPSHDNRMVDLLARDSKLQVVLAASGVALRPGHVYVMPPGIFLTLQDGVLHSAAPESGKSVRLPFDTFLKSLAKDPPSRMGCIILSGTGADGSAALGAIHCAGGLIIAQDPQEAAHSGMPKSALKTGLVDLVLRVGDMPGILGELVSCDAPVRGAAKGATKAKAGGEADHHPAEPLTVADGAFDDIIALVARTGPQDVTLYNSGTIRHRIGHRMAIAGFGPSQTGPYLAMLHADAGELARLRADLLIHVSSFFRSPAAFAQLSEVMLPAMIASRPAGRPLRAWVAGCGTGEEAYSLAMVCLEALEEAGSHAGLQVFASDIDPDAIATARRGVYPKEIEDSVSSERLARFFIVDGTGWRVRPELRNVIVFSRADLLSDPPFHKMDIVSCRTVLSYLGPEAQRRGIGQCCVALRQGGMLLLGPDEAPGPADGCFDLVDKETRIWRCARRIQSEDPHVAAVMKPGRPLVQGNRRAAHADLCDRIVLESYAPAAVLLNQNFDCLYLMGPIERYLCVRKGHPDPGFLAMLPRTLHARFRAAAACCDASNPLIVVPGTGSGPEGRFSIELRALTEGEEELLLARFVDVPQNVAPARSDNATADSDASRVAELEAELEATREDLRAALRDLEQEVEWHAADRAEAMSVAEEFQCANEELLASKEELQALNEELTTLNAQLHETLDCHGTTAKDLQNVLCSSDVATLFLDVDLNIRFFTPTARAVFRVIPTDIGRPLTDLATLSRDEHLTVDARVVLGSSEPIKREISAFGGMWFQRSVQPCRTDDGRIEGVVITYTDITERKHIHEALLEEKRAADRATVTKSQFLTAVSHDLRQPLQSLALLHNLMSRNRRGEEGPRLSALMNRTLHAMTDMLDSLLDLNRIDSGVLRPNSHPTAIAPLIAELGDEFAQLCKFRGLKFRLVQCNAWVRTDPKFLRQILRNLLTNALKYTVKGGILMGCRIRGDHLLIQVWDSGIGIAEDERITIFEAYHQIEPSRGQGLGLGLSIVQRLAELLEHPVTVHSTPGKGSVFTLTLPIVSPDHKALSQTPPARAKADAPRTTGVILLVEDDDDLRALLVELLEGEGHSVTAMSGAQDALAWATETVCPPDLLLADFELRGGGSGLSLAQALPDVLGFSVPTLVLTGDIAAATMQDIAAARLAQIAKPVCPDVLLDRISELLHSCGSAFAKCGPESMAPECASLHMVDDDPIIREATGRVFEAEGWSVVTYPSAEAFLAAPRPSPGACLVVDGRLPGIGGVELLEALREEGTLLPTVMLTGHGDVSMAVDAIRAGAADLIEKPATVAELFASIRRAFEQSSAHHPCTTAQHNARKAFDALTPRERDVLDKVLKGAPNKIIAAELRINQRTVENHRAAVMRKTGATSLPELFRLALVAGVANVA